MVGRKARQNLIGQKILQWFRNTMKCWPGLCSEQTADISKLRIYLCAPVHCSLTQVVIIISDGREIKKQTIDEHEELQRLRDISY